MSFSISYFIFLALLFSSPSLSSSKFGTLRSTPPSETSIRSQRTVNEAFLWGVATAAYQIEGAVHEDGRGDSIWDTFSRIPGKISHNQNGNIADDSYHQYEKDIERLKELGVNAYRFSISWTRILPLGYARNKDDINQLGIDYYNRFINRLLEEKIEPLITLYHWDLPQGIEDHYQGLLNSSFETFLVAYADICFHAFGDRVKKWITINEPWTVSYLGYGVGAFAPGRCSDRTRCQEGNSSIESYIVGHNLLNAHAAVVELYRTKYQSHQKGIIGITINHDWAEPLTEHPEDIRAAEVRREFQLGWFTDPIYFGDYPSTMQSLVGNRLPKFTAQQKLRLKGSIDFLGLNHYTSKYFFVRRKGKSPVSSSELINGINITSVEESLKYGGWADDQLNYETKYSKDGNLIGLQGQSTWLNVVPWGFYNTIMWVHNRYKLTPFGEVPILITENGCDAPGETEKPTQEALHDRFRYCTSQNFILDSHSFFF